MKYFLLLTSLIPVYLSAQSLSPERVAKIKASTVRITIEGDQTTGTGFFINKSGRIATCWHVVAPAAAGLKMFIRYNDGDSAEVKFLPYFFPDSILFKAVGYDFCVLDPVNPITKKISFLTLGSFKNVSEGQEVYTCGYPLGFPQQFISKGIISTKYINTAWGIFNSVTNQNISMPRQEALLDLTLNRGNSGGAIVKIGKTIQEDEVIGIADFIVNPLGGKADSLVYSLTHQSVRITFNSHTDANGIHTETDYSKVAAIFAEAIGSLSIGVSGCISVEYLRDVAQAIK